MRPPGPLGQRPLTLLGNRTPNPGAYPWLPGTEGLNFEDKIPEALGKLVLTPGGPQIKNWTELTWLGENLYQVLQNLLEGSHMTYMMKNLDQYKSAISLNQGTKVIIEFQEGFSLSEEEE